MRIRPACFGLKAIAPAVTACLLIGSCGGDASTLRVFATVARGQPIIDLHVTVSVSGEDNVSVTVNGTDIPWSDWNLYSSFGTPDINVGDPVDLVVSSGGRLVTGRLIMPAEPVLSSPTAGAGPYDAAAPLTVRWAALSPAPQEVRIRLSGSFTASGFEYTDTQSGGATFAVIPGGTIAVGASNVTLEVTAFSTIPLSSWPAAPGSWMQVFYAARSEPFDTQ